MTDYALAQAALDRQHRDKQAAIRALIDQSLQILDCAKKDQRKPTADETAELERLDAELDRLEAEYEAMPAPSLPGRGACEVVPARRARRRDTGQAPAGLGAPRPPAPPGDNVAC